jgi:hypothetical protein
MPTKIDQMQQRIQKIKSALMELGEMRPGALSEQYNVCGTPGCRCKDPKAPKRHGPYYQLSYTHEGKSTTEFVKKPMVAEVKKQIQNYAKFRQLTNDWVALSLKIARAKRNSPS